MPAPRHLYIAIVLFFAALAVRLYANPESLWYDEMYSLTRYISRPWMTTLTGMGNEGATYTPNNHVLSSLLIKTTYGVATALGLPPAWLYLNDTPDSPVILPAGAGGRTTVQLRLPALIAGSLAPLGLAWPLRPRRMQATGAALLQPFYLLACLGILSPWLIAMSTEARGYSLLLLFSLLATNLLPVLHRRLSVGYVLSMVAAIYTVPIALVLLPAHAVTLLLARVGRGTWMRWLFAAGMVLAGAFLLYLPMISAMRAYAASIHAAPEPVFYSLVAAVRSILAGYNDGGIISLMLPLLLLPAGLLLAWRNFPALRPHLVAYGTATLLTLAAPVVFPSLAGARFFVWLLPPALIALAGLLVALKKISPPAVLAALLMAVALFLVPIYRLARIPPQPIREAIALADALAPPDAAIVGAYLGANESLSLYVLSIQHENYAAVHTPAELRAHPHDWLIVFYNDLLATGDPALYAQLTATHHLQAVLPGRISSCGIYAPNADAPASAPQAAPATQSQIPR